MPNKSFLTNIDFKNNEIINYSDEKLETAPVSNLFEGRKYYNTSTHKNYVYNGTSWVDVTDSGGSIMANQLLSGTVNGSNVTFTLPTIPNGEVLLYASGVRLLPTADYTVSGDTVTMVSAPETGTVLYADYNINTYRVGVNSEVLSANKSIASTDKTTQLLDPNGSDRNITLYASPTAGDYFLFRNSGTGGFNLTIKNNAGTTLVNISNGVSIALLYSGTNWILV